MRTRENAMDILLVEDNSADAYLLTEIFSRQSQASSIHWVSDGYDALDYIMQKEKYQYAMRPDMILLDLNMPRISGYEVLREMKGNASLHDIPVIILTTSRDPLDHTQCKALGADICLSKPHGLKEYEEMVQRVMSWAALRLATSSNASTTVN